MENKTIKEFGSLSASSDPVPGGGGVSAAIGSLAAALAEMVVNLTLGKPKYQIYEKQLQDIKDELIVIREKLLEMINKDAEAFLPLSKTYKMSKDDPDYETRMEKCLRNAAAVPFEILKYASRIIELDESLALIGSKISVSDAATSVMLANGVLYGGYINTIVNTNLMKDKIYAGKYANEAKKILNEYSDKALKVFNDIERRLNNG